MGLWGLQRKIFSEGSKCQIPYIFKEGKQESVLTRVLICYLQNIKKLQNKVTMKKVGYSTCQECGTKKKSESPTGIETMTFRRLEALTTELLEDSW